MLHWKSRMESKEILGLRIVTNFGTFAEFHAIASQKLDKMKTEDEKLKTLQLVKFIYENVLDTVLYSAVNEPLFNPCIGHFISTLINVAINDKYFKIKNEVIEIIDLIINRLRNYYRQTKKGHNPSDLLASFLPGISQFLMKMITKDEKQNRIVFINSLKALSSLFICVYQNYEDGLSEKLENYPFLMPRTKEWCVKSIEKLSIIIELIERSLIKQQSIQIKEALINFVSIMVFHIVDHQENHELMPLIGRNLFRIPLILLYDENETIQQLSQSFTQLVSSKFTYQNSKVFTLEEQLMDDFLRLLDDFEKELSVYNEETILNNLKLLCGHLNCFEKDKFNLILFNHRDKFFNLLKLILRLDFNRMSANVLLKEQTEFTNLDFFDKKFFYFEDKKILHQLNVLCRLIKKTSDQNLLNDYLLESLSEIRFVNHLSLDDFDGIKSDENNSNKDKSAKLIVLSYLVKTLGSNQFNLQIINRLIELLENKINELDNDQLYLDERFELIVICAILIEAITNFAHSINEDEQRIYFMSTLYTIMACTGSIHLQIQINAKASIVKLASIFNYSSVKDLILSNIDYVISKMHIKLNNLNDKENLYFVFRIIFEFTDHEVCYYFDQTINNLIIAMDINYSVVNFERLARILLLIVNTFKKWFVKNEIPTKENLSKEKKVDLTKIKLNEFRSDLIEFLKKKEQDKENLKKFEEDLKDDREPVRDETILKQEMENEEENLDEEENAKNEKLPIHIDYTKKILEKCSNFLSHNSKQVRLIVLDIMIDGLDVLKLHEDSLLPTAHIIWESLIHRFKDDPIVLFKCVKCLVTLASNCGDFIRSRTIKQILPQIYSFLKLNWKKSLINHSGNKRKISNENLSSDKNRAKSIISSLLPKNQESISSNQLISLSEKSVNNSSNTFYHTLDYRLQQQLLEQLGELALNIRLTGKDLWPLISILIFYLNDEQPIELKSAAYSSLYQLESLDDYAVYFFKNYNFHNSF